MVHVETAPLFGHANEARECVEDHGDNGQRQEAHADAVPESGDVEIHADAAEQSKSREDVRLPRQFLELEALINDCQDQRKRCPEWSEPTIGVFIPCK